MSLEIRELDLLHEFPLTESSSQTSAIWLRNPSGSKVVELSRVETGGHVLVSRRNLLQVLSPRRLVKGEWRMHLFDGWLMGSTYGWIRASNCNERLDNRS